MTIHNHVVDGHMREREREIHIVVQHISNAHANFQPHSMFSDGEGITLPQCMLWGNYAVKHYKSMYIRHMEEGSGRGQGGRGGEGGRGRELLLLHIC